MSYKGKGWFLLIKLALAGIVLLLSVEIANAAGPVVENIRIGTHVNKTRFVIDISNNIEFRIFTLSDPYRVVIDLPEIRWRLPDNVVQRTLKRKNNLISNFRYGYFRSGLSRVVIDTDKPVKIKSAFLMPPSGGKSYRLVVDLVRTSRKQFLVTLKNSKKIIVKSIPGLIVKLNNKPLATASKSRKKKTPPSSADSKKSEIIKPVIVIDPGHGGIDPGSTSGRVFEKHITLSAAKVIQNHLQKLGRYRVFLTRTNDKFIRLRKRIAIAKDRGASLFISLHADAIRNRRVRGLSVYTLSEKASDKEAADLARKENKADIIAGANLSDNSPVVSDILISLAQRDTMNSSSIFAAALVKQMRKVTKTLSNAHRFAGFAVLKSPDIPSILIEMGFLSNRADEKALLNPRYRELLAQSIGRAVDDYFYK